MAVKSFALLFLQVLLIKVIAAYPCSPCAGFQSTRLHTPEDLAAASGGLLIVNTGSPLAPTGISVLSENIIEGVLSVEGHLPFLGTVSLEGDVPTLGTGTVAYGCGNGNVGMVAEEISPGCYAGCAFAPRDLGCSAII